MCDNMSVPLLAETVDYLMAAGRTRLIRRFLGVREGRDDALAQRRAVSLQLRRRRLHGAG